MGRLIDSDDVVKVFANRFAEIVKKQLPCDTATEQRILYETCYNMAKYEIDNIPTAYDVEKVVEELEEEREEILYSNDYEIEIINWCLDNFDRAIEIVERGGKNDD